MHLKRCFVSIIPHENDGFGAKLFYKVV